jgi:hypothetical protein
VPELTNRRQELFARHLGEGDHTMTQALAYELAGYTPSASNASVLANKPEIAERIKEIRAEKERRELEFRVRLHEAGLDEKDPETAKRVVIEWNDNVVRDMLSENARLAQVAGQFQAAKESIKLIGDSLGTFDKATAADNKKLPAPAGSPLQVSFNLNGALEGAAASVEEPADDNPLAPRKK